MKKPTKAIFPDLLTTLDTPLVLSYEKDVPTITTTNKVEICSTLPMELTKPLEQIEQLGCVKLKKKVISKKTHKTNGCEFVAEPKLPQNKLTLYHVFIADQRKILAELNPCLSKGEILTMARQEYKNSKLVVL